MQADVAYTQCLGEWLLEHAVGDKSEPDESESESDGNESDDSNAEEVDLSGVPETIVHVCAQQHTHETFYMVKFEGDPEPRPVLKTAADDDPQFDTVIDAFNVQEAERRREENAAAYAACNGGDAMTDGGVFGAPRRAAAPPPIQSTRATRSGGFTAVARLEHCTCPAKQQCWCNQLHSRRRGGASSD